MRNIRSRVERFFEKLGIFLFQNPLKSLFVILLFIGFLTYQCVHLTVDTSSKAMFREDDPSMIDFEAFLDDFGRSGMVVIGIQPAEIFNTDFLVKLKSFHKELENEVPYIRSVGSLINARKTSGQGDMLLVEDLFKDWPEKNVDLASIKDDVLKNPYYSNNIISEDGRLTAVVLEIIASVAKKYEEDELLDDFDTETVISEEKSEKPQGLTPKEFKEIVEAVNSVTDRYAGPDFQMFVSGGPIISDAYNRYTMNDMLLCMGLGTVTMIFFVFLLFRRVSGVILPAIVVELAVVCTLGLMAFFGAPITEMTMVLPAFLLAVGVADSIHVLAIFYHHFDKGYSKEEAVAYSLSHSGLAIVLTSLTTAAGLLSFYFAELTAIAEMGIYSATGVIIALFLTIFMLPPLLGLIPIKPKLSAKDGEKKSAIDRFLQFFADFSTTHPVKILIGCLAIFIFSFIYSFRLEFSHNFLSYFPDSMRVKHDVTFIDKKLKGITTLEVIVDTMQENGVQAPDILNRIEIFTKKIKKMDQPDIYAGKVFSINDILKECNQALHKNNLEFYTIPQDQETIAQEFLLFETSGSNDLSRWVDSQFSKTRITIKTPAVDAVIYEKYIEDIKRLAQSVFENNVKITVTGGAALVARTVPVALRSMAKSYLIAFVVITIMMIFLVGSIQTGLLSMLPNLLPILFTMGIMGVADIQMNLTTLMIGSIAIGLVVDDTVHFMYNFQKYYEMTGNAQMAVQKTLLSTGRALLITTLILSFGFFVLIFASLNHMVKFGFFTGLTILFALFADFMMAPALMTLVKGSRKGSV